MPSSEDKIIDFHISRLKDKNPQVQLKSIEGLLALKEKAARAIDALRVCYENSDDEVVKKAARQAGFDIFMATRNGSD